MKITFTPRTLDRLGLSRKQLDRLLDLAHEDDRRRTRQKHYLQCAFFWLTMCGLGFAGHFLSTPRLPLFWVTQLFFAVMSFVFVLLSDRLYLIIPDIKGRYDDIR